MRHIAMRTLSLVFAVTLASARLAADEPKKGEATPDNKLVGTWKLVSAKFGGRVVKFPAGVTTIKHVTAAHFMWAGYGKVASALGGPYTVKGDKYEETPGYGTDDVLRLTGKTHSFKWKIEGNKWYTDGKLSTGLAIEEV